MHTATFPSCPVVLDRGGTKNAEPITVDSAEVVYTVSQSFPYIWFCHELIGRRIIWIVLYIIPNPGYKLNEELLYVRPPGPMTKFNNYFYTTGNHILEIVIDNTSLGGKLLQQISSTFHTFSEKCCYSVGYL